MGCRTGHGKAKQRYRLYRWHKASAKIQVQMTWSVSTHPYPGAPEQGLNHWVCLALKQRELGFGSYSSVNQRLKAAPAVKVKVKSLSRVRLFVTPRTAAYQASPSMGFSRQKYWSGLPFPSPEDLPVQPRDRIQVSRVVARCFYRLSRQEAPAVGGHKIRGNHKP